MNVSSAPSAIPRSAVPPFRVLVVPGDGIGREVIPAALEVLRATGLPFEFGTAEAGWECFERHGASLPEETLAAARAADAVLFGAVNSPSHAVVGYRSPIVGLRRALDLYANIRPVSGGWELGVRGWGGSTNPQLPSPNPPVDLVVVRENTEGLYAGQETNDGETAIARRVITRSASERIARAAFELARSRGGARDSRLEASESLQASSLKPQASPRSRGGARDLRLEASESLQASSLKPQASRVTIVHKANVLRETCGLFRAAALRVAGEYPDVAVDEQLVDSAALQLVQRPERFDVLVTTNMFGDILSDVASYWCGGLGLATSANIGDGHALFEPVHGSAPDIAGKGIANPLAAVGCAAMLLEYLGRPTTPSTTRFPSISRGRAGNDQRPTTNDQRQDPYGGSSVSAASRDETSGHEATAVRAQCREWADRIRAAIRTTLESDRRTPDLGGAATTEAVTMAVIDAMKVA